MRIIETFGRGLLLAIRSQFDTPIEAICELVDNALDHSLGQSVRIDVDLVPDGFRITNVGGRGMGLRELARYVNWGGRNDYESGDRGHFGQGGKAAMCYLGRGFRLWCKRAGEEGVYLLEDPDVLGRLGDGPRDYGDLAPLPEAQIPEDLRGIAADSGFVRIQSIDFSLELSLTASNLARELAAIYIPVLRGESASIHVNGEPLELVEVVLDPDLATAPIAVDIDGISATGWAGKLLKGANRAQAVRPGYALIWKGRRVRTGVWFNANPFAKGALASFYGELEITGKVTPNLNKTGFLQTGEVVWDRLSDAILAQSAPVLDALRAPGGLAVVTSRDVRLARSVRNELEEILGSLASVERETYEDEVRIVITQRASGGPRDIVVSGRRSGEGGPVLHPQGDHRGKAVKERSVPSIPEIVVDSWDAPVRSEVRELSGGGILIAINKAHPAYATANAKYAIAEGVVTQVFRNRESDVSAFLCSADAALAAWGQRQDRVEEE